MAKNTSGVTIEVVDEVDRIDSLVEESQNKLVVIDVHATWCGPCEALKPTLNKIALDYAHSEDRITFASCDIDKFGSKLQETLPSESNISLEKNGCLPIMLVYRFGSCIGTLVGVDGPALQGLVEINIPQAVSAAE